MPTTCAGYSTAAHRAGKVLLHIEAACLAALTVLLAGPASAGLARARWTARSPRVALVLWQAVGLGGGLGVLSAGLTLAAADLAGQWAAGVAAVPGQWRRFGPTGWLGMGITLGVGVYLVSATVTSTMRVLADRRSHRRRLAVISTPLEPRGAAGRETGAPVRLVDHPHAVAYCLPGFRPRVVLTRGALDVLDAAELEAVLAHEQAHARGRHDLVIQPFIAWATTFPFLPPARRAVGAVTLLVEMLADDAAVRRCGRAPLHSALRTLSEQHLAVGGADTDAWRRQMRARMTRIAAEAPQALPRPVSALVYGAALALVVAPPMVLLLS